MKPETNGNGWGVLAYALLLLVLIVPPRVIAIDRVVTVDEPWWVISGSNYYYALARRDFENTLYDYHPAVTTTWMVAAGMVSYFPEYRGLGQGYFDVRKPNFEEFLRAQGRDALELTRLSRLVQSAVLIALAVLSFFLLARLAGERSAFLSLALAMTAPFFLGHSRLLNHEGLLSMFVLTTLLAMHVYLNQRRRLVFLILSGAAFGLAQLTKSPSLVLIPLIGLMLLAGLFKKNEQTFPAKVWDAVKTFAIWLGIAALVYFIVWPGMWVDAKRMLTEVYGNAFSYAFQGARLDVTEELEPENFSLVTRFDGILLYLRFWASSTTFITWIGLAFTAFFFFSKDREKLPPPLRTMLVYLTILGTLFILMFGLAQGRNAAHYIMSVYVALDVMAGVGWGAAVMWAQNRWKWMSPKYSLAGMTALILAQIGFGLPYAPYYFTYKNPLASEAATYGYGEGMAEAADYLSQKPHAEEMRVYVYNGMGTFSYFFPGETVVLKRIHLIEGDFDTIKKELSRSDYLVLYPVMRERQPEMEKLLLPLRDVPPEKIMTINGVEYIYIYRVADIPQAVYDALAP